MFVLSPASLLDELPHPVQIPGVELCCAFSLLIPSIASNNASSALGSCSPHFDLCFVGWSAVSPSCCGVAMVSVPQQAVVWGGLQMQWPPPCSFLPISAGWPRKVPKAQMASAAHTNEPLYFFHLLSLVLKRKSPFINSW